MSGKKPLYKVRHSKLESSEKSSPHLFVQHLIANSLGDKIKHFIFQHGAIEYQERHRDLFDSLAGEFRENFVISTLDLVGHGKSGGERGHVSSFDNYLQDWQSFLNHCKDEFYSERDVETYIISHSLGGLIVLNAILSEEVEIPFPIHKTIFCNPCIKPMLEIPSWASRFLDTYAADAIGRMRIPLIYGAQDLSHDDEKIVEFTEDPLISKAITIKMGLEIINACERLSGQSYFFPYPALFLLSGDDRIVDKNRTEVFLSGMEKHLIVKKVYPKMLHDLFNETCRTEVFQEIIDFIKSDPENL